MNNIAYHISVLFVIITLLKLIYSLNKKLEKNNKNLMNLYMNNKFIDSLLSIATEGKDSIKISCSKDKTLLTNKNKDLFDRLSLIIKNSIKKYFELSNISIIEDASEEDLIKMIKSHLYKLEKLEYFIDLFKKGKLINLYDKINNQWIVLYKIDFNKNRNYKFIYSVLTNKVAMNNFELETFTSAIKIIKLIELLL